MGLGDSHVTQSLVKSGETSLVQLYVHSIAGMHALDMSLVAIPGCVERGSAKRFGQVRREALVVLRMEFVLEGVRGHGVR